MRRYKEDTSKGYMVNMLTYKDIFTKSNGTFLEAKGVGANKMVREGKVNAIFSAVGIGVRNERLSSIVRKR